MTLRLSRYLVVAVLAVASLAAPRALAAQTKAPAQYDPIVARSKGSPTAPVTVYEMSDFQCPFCKRYALDIFPELERDYVATGKVRWVFIHFPLTDIHDNAVAAAEVATCAGRQKAFWPVHDLLFKHQAVWAPLKEPGPFLVTLADSAKINRDTLVSCLQSKAARREVAEDAAGASRAGANSTPTFYIEGGLLAGAQPARIFRPILDSIYAAKTKKPVTRSP